MVFNSESLWGNMGYSGLIRSPCEQNVEQRNINADLQLDLPSRGRCEASYSDPFDVAASRAGNSTHVDCLAAASRGAVPAGLAAEGNGGVDGIA